MIVVFAPTSAEAETATLSLGSNQQSDVTMTGTGVQLSPGQSIVAGTDNPMVASYTYDPPTSGDVSVEFGSDTNYGLQTSAVAATAGTPVVLLVAGMRAGSTYHMRASVNDGGAITADSDQTFSTSSFPSGVLPSLSVTTNGTPQPGIEMADAVNLTAGAVYMQAYAVDLQGNLIWGYNQPDRPLNELVQPVKLLPNGNVLLIISLNSPQVPTSNASYGQTIVLREIDLAGVPVRQLTLNQINSALANAGQNISLLDIHHDVEVLPNGHWVVVGNLAKTVNGTNVLGDVLVDIDLSSKVTWVWSEFDHLDVTRAPAGYPDWTHTNAVLYVPGDGNLLVSSRHQSWVMKVDYRDGAGTGAVIWKLGYQGDFKLVNGTEPQDWFYGQHQPSFVGNSTSGVFELTLMDNGYTRQLSPGVQCSGSACYTTVPILQVDESAKTATILWRDIFDPSKYSVWGGGTTPLANGDLEIDLCAEGANSEVDEVTVGSGAPQVVWQLKSTGENLYRANRVPSLYPGVQW